MALDDFASDLASLDFTGMSREDVLAALVEAAQRAADDGEDAGFSVSCAGSPCSEAHFYSPDQARDHRGRWTAGGGSGGGGTTAEERASARENRHADARAAVAKFLAGKGTPTRGEVAAVAEHLAGMTVKQLQGLRQEHGLKDPRLLKADLVTALHGYFVARRAGTTEGKAQPHPLDAAAAGRPGWTESKPILGGDRAYTHTPTGARVESHGGLHTAYAAGLVNLGRHGDAAQAVKTAEASGRPAAPPQPQAGDVLKAHQTQAGADRPPEPGFTGVDRLGRRWENGELVAAREDAGAGGGKGGPAQVAAAMRQVEGSGVEHGGMVLTRDIRRALPGTSREEFDRTLLGMVEQGVLSPVMHNQPSFLTDAERREMWSLPAGVVSRAGMGGADALQVHQADGRVYFAGVSVADPEKFRALAAGAPAASPAPAAGGKAPPHAELLDAMRKVEPQAANGAMVSLRDLRRSMPGVSKEGFDKAVLSLGRAGKIDLHAHDLPSSLTPAERAELVVGEGGRHYNGAVIRAGALEKAAAAPAAGKAGDHEQAGKALRAAVDAHVQSMHGGAAAHEVLPRARQDVERAAAGVKTKADADALARGFGVLPGKTVKDTLDTVRGQVERRIGSLARVHAGGFTPGAAPPPAAPAPAAGRAGGFDAHAEAKALRDAVDAHVAAARAAAAEDDRLESRGGKNFDKSPRMGEAVRRGIEDSNARIDALLARVPTKAAAMTIAREHGIVVAHGRSKEDVLEEVRKTIRQRLGTFARGYFSLETPGSPATPSYDPRGAAAFSVAGALPPREADLARARRGVEDWAQRVNDRQRRARAGANA